VNLLLGYVRHPAASRMCYAGQPDLAASGVTFQQRSRSHKDFGADPPWAAPVRAMMSGAAEAAH